jgi:Tfp pilus assembly protein PilN
MKRINLLPPEQRVKAARELGVLYALVGLLVLVVVLGVTYVWQNGRVSGKQTRVTALQTQVQQAQAQAAALQPYETLQSQRTSMADTAKQIYDSRVIWSSILQEISLVIPDTVQLTGINAAVPTNMLAGGQLVSGPGGTASTVDITFTGYAMTHNDVAEFMTRLGLLPQIENIKLTNSALTPVNGTIMASYQVTVQLRPFLVAPPLSGSITPATTPLPTAAPATTPSPGASP